MPTKRIDKTSFNDLFSFQRKKVVDSLLDLVMDGERITWQSDSRAVSVYMRENCDFPQTTPYELEPPIAKALRTFNRAPDGFTMRQLLDANQCGSEAA